MAADILAFVERLRRDPAGAAALREACARHAATRYGWDQVVGGLARTLASLAEGPTSGALAAEPCEACGGSMRASRLLYDGQRYGRCPRCRARRLVTLPSAVEVLREYEVRYPRRFPPARIETGRRAMLHSLLDRAHRWTTPGRLLDVGCGGGYLMADAVASGWRPLGTDLSREACVAARRVAAAPCVQADADALPFRDGALDAVTLVNVLDHTTRPLAAVREAARVLRPGGLLVVRVPNGGFHAAWAGVLGRLGPGVRWRGWDAYPILHVFAFGPRALRRLVERAGFEVLETANSALASSGPPRAGLAAAAVRGLTRGAAGVVSALSGGRWLAGPSIEVYARRPVESPR